MRQKLTGRPRWHCCLPFWCFPRYSVVCITDKDYTVSENGTWVIVIWSGKSNQNMEVSGAHRTTRFTKLPSNYTFIYEIQSTQDGSRIMRRKFDWVTLSVEVVAVVAIDWREWYDRQTGCLWCLALSCLPWKRCHNCQFMSLFSLIVADVAIERWIVAETQNGFKLKREKRAKWVSERGQVGDVVVEWKHKGEWQIDRVSAVPVPKWKEK